MNPPVFTCVIPVKGPRPYFDEAVASLQNQGVDDTLEIIVQDGDAESDAGQSDALNKGFAKAKGEWLFWLNADDLLLPGALKRVLDRINKIDGIEWIVGNQLLIDDAGNVLKCSVGNGWHDWLYKNAVPHVYGPSAFFRRELFEKVGGFDTSLKYCMDWELWIKFMKAGAKYVRINDYLWAQRQWSGSKTQRPLTKEEWAEQQGEIRQMLAKNGLSVTKWGALKTRIWRMMNGNYLKEAIDTFRMRGRCVS